MLKNLKQAIDFLVDFITIAIIQLSVISLLDSKICFIDDIIDL